METLDYDVVIVGAGIAGASLACFLAASKLKVAIVDAAKIAPQQPKPAQHYADVDPRVLALTGASRELLTALQVWPEIAALGVSPYRTMEVWDADGTGLVEFDCADVSRTELGSIVENRVLVWSLQQRLKHLGVSCYEECRVTSMAAGDVALDSGRILSATLIVGADGANSSIRQLANIGVHSHDSQQKAIVCNIETELPHNEVARQRFLSTGPLAFLPVGAVADNVCSIVWSLDSDCADDYLNMDDEAFKQALAEAFEHRLGRVLQVSRRFAFPLIAKHARQYVSASVLLIGDAAHVIHPLAGQGINLGLQDVKALSRILIDAANRGIAIDSERVLAAYQRARRGENLKMLALMQGFKSLFGRRELSLRWLRNSGMRFVNSQAKLKRAIIKQAIGL